MNATKLEQYRRQTFRLDEARKLQTAADALQFVNERGFVHLWPIKGVDLPSLWTAVAGDRPVADKHDDPGHITWGWKDAMLDKKAWHYAKILRGKATLISLEILPYFYALSENYGDPKQDYQELFAQGLLSREAKIIYETLLQEGQLRGQPALRVQDEGGAVEDLVVLPAREVEVDERQPGLDRTRDHERLPHVLLAAVVGRSVRDEEDLRPALGERFGHVVEPGVLAYRSADPDGTHAIGAGQGTRVVDPHLVEDSVVGQVMLQDARLHRAAFEDPVAVV